MLRLYYTCLLIIVILPQVLKAEDTCSRTAVINFQEVLIDSGPNKKGEGLRFYLEKDEVAQELLNRYQDRKLLSILNASLGTIGTGFILAGIIRSSANESRSLKSERASLITGASILLTNFLIAKTLDYDREKYLVRAVEEYNKRNLPRIYFNPFQGGNDSSKLNKIGIQGGIYKEF